MFTLTQAALEVDRTRSTLFKAIKSGRLSATKDAQGHYLIDPAELHRVYVAVNVSQRNQTKQAETVNDIKEIEFLRRENELLRQQAQRDREQIEREQSQADHWRQTATMLLTHQPQAESSILVFEDHAAKETSLLWKKLFSR